MSKNGKNRRERQTNREDAVARRNPQAAQGAIDRLEWLKDEIELLFSMRDMARQQGYQIAEIETVADFPYPVPPHEQDIQTVITHRGPNHEQTIDEWMVHAAIAMRITGIGETGRTRRDSEARTYGEPELEVDEVVKQFFTDIPWNNLLAIRHITAHPERLNWRTALAEDFGPLAQKMEVAASMLEKTLSAFDVNRQQWSRPADDQEEEALREALYNERYKDWRRPWSDIARSVHALRYMADSARLITEYRQYDRLSSAPPELAQNIAADAIRYQELFCGTLQYRHLTDPQRERGLERLLGTNAYTEQLRWRRNDLAHNQGFADDQPLRTEGLRANHHAASVLVEQETGQEQTPLIQTNHDAEAYRPVGRKGSDKNADGQQKRRRGDGEDAKSRWKAARSEERYQRRLAEARGDHLSEGEADVSQASPVATGARTGSLPTQVKSAADHRAQEDTALQPIFEQIRTTIDAWQGSGLYRFPEALANNLTERMQRFVRHEYREDAKTVFLNTDVIRVAMEQIEGLLPYLASKNVNHAQKKELAGWYLDFRSLPEEIQDMLETVLSPRNMHPKHQESVKALSKVYTQARDMFFVHPEMLLAGIESTAAQEYLEDAVRATALHMNAAQQDQLSLLVNSLNRLVGQSQADATLILQHLFDIDESIKPIMEALITCAVTHHAYDGALDAAAKQLDIVPLTTDSPTLTRRSSAKIYQLTLENCPDAKLTADAVAEILTINARTAEYANYL